jgi:diamine N-acetyltransferase
MTQHDEPTAPLPADAPVTLREITKENVYAILRLTVSEHQRNFVADNARSIAEAHFEPHAWFRAIYADETPIGFAMLYDDPEKPTYYLWRFMIDQRYQRRGFGWQALRLIVEHVKTRPNAQVLLCSYVPGDGSPGNFYHKFGFVDTGEVDDGELVTGLALD